jgi:deazaflavin-dependent oxidoreductase (nitroreductase family)
VSGTRNPQDRLRPLRRLAAPIEAAEIRRFGRSVLSTLYRTPVLVLETTGRRTGRIRSTPLAYHRDVDGSLLVVGGAGGQARTPDWVHNLRAAPHGAITVGRVRREVTATELTGHEREAAWPELRRVFPRIDQYERQAGHPIPVFRFR